jgi:hypothetical protein
MILAQKIWVLSKREATALVRCGRRYVPEYFSNMSLLANASFATSE